MNKKNVNEKQKMEEALREIAELSDAELRQQLVKRGEAVGPILHSLRKLFQRKLAKHILRERGIDADEELTNDTNESTGSHCKENDSDRLLCKVSQSEKDRQDQSGRQAAEHAEDREEVMTSYIRGTSTHDVALLSAPMMTGSAEGEADDAERVYYGISLPSYLCRNQADDYLVYQDKTKALKMMKECKGSRFKVFKNREDAVSFCKIPAEEICPSPKRPPSSDVRKDEQSLTQKPGLQEEKCPYREPSRVDRLNLMKLVEKGEVEEVKKMLWNNPRIVISNGDTPVILQESFRYNALHIAAKHNQAAICQLYIDTIEDESFLKLMFPSDSPNTTASRINFLLDLYLNMPEKGVFDGVLHTASKYGALATVQILAAHPQTDLNLRNKYDETPADVVCRRARVASPELKGKILEILSSNFYVPLLRTEDNTEPPFVGKPWSPDPRMKELDTDLSSAQELMAPDTRDLLYGPASSHLSRTPRDPKLKVRAYAGPMSSSQADKFYQNWHSCPAQSPDHVKRKYHELRRGDMEKGPERLGRDLAHDLHVPWTEHWDFLDSWADLSGPGGLKILEDYLRRIAQKQCQNIDLLHVNNNDEKAGKVEDDSFLNLADLKIANSCSCETDNLLNDSFDERLHVNLGRVHCLKCGGTKEFGNGAEGDEHNLSQQSSDGANSSLGSLIERMGNLNVNDSLEDRGGSGEKLSKFSLNSKNDKSHNDATYGDEESNSDDDDEFFESEADGGYRVEAVIENIAAECRSGLESASLKCDVIHRAEANEDSRRWSVVGVLRNAFAGLQIFSPRKAEKTKPVAGCGEISVGLGEEEASSDNSDDDDDDAFLDAEDSVLDNPGDITPASAAGIQDVCSTPKCGYSASRQFPERQDSVLFPGRLQRIFIEGNKPTKLDLDVLRAVESVDVDPDLYPYTAKWKETVTQFSGKEQSRWPSPAAVRRKTVLRTPQNQTRTVFQTTPSISQSTNEIVSRLQF